MFNIRENAYKLYVDQEIKEHQLRYLFLEITRRCNLSCIHCGSDCSKDLKMQEMTLESWQNIIKAMQDRYSPTFVITGGEPLVSEGFNQISKTLKDVNASWGMVTNGMLLTRDKMKMIVENGLDSMTISLDGTEKNHKYIRRHPKSFKKALNAVEILGESEITYKDVVSCVFKGNINELDKIADMLVDRGINSWRLFRIFPKGKAAGNDYLKLSFDESRAVVDWIAKNRKKYKKKGLDINFSCEGYLPFSKDRKVRKEPFFCRAGINIASILSDGSITGCNNNGEQFYQGNIIRDDFSEVWEKRFLDYREPLWKKTGVCADCKHWKFCRGGSIHLRDKNQENPLFCYVKDVEK